MLWDEAVLIHFTVKKPRSNPDEHCHEDCAEWEVLEVCFPAPALYVTPGINYLHLWICSGTASTFARCGPIMAGTTSCRTISEGGRGSSSLGPIEERRGVEALSLLESFLLVFFFY